MAKQHYREYDDEDDIVRYYQVNETGTLVISIGQGKKTGCYSISNFPFEVRILGQPVERHEFQVVFEIAYNFIKKRFSLY